MTPLEKLLNRSDKTEIKKLNKLVDEIDALEEKISSLNDEELKNMTNIFKEKLRKIKEKYDPYNFFDFEQSIML